MFTRSEIEKGKVWILSDTHFSHNNIVQYCMRPGFDVHGNHDYERHNLLMQQMWLERVRANDTVLHLGDVGHGAREYASHLPGKVIWVRGNHDSNKVKEMCDQMGWRLVDPFTIIWPDQQGKPTEVLFSHYPIRQLAKGKGNVHGHVHNNPYNGSPAHVNVSIENTGYGPLPLRDVLAKAVFGAPRAAKGAGDGDKSESSILSAAARNILDLAPAGSVTLGQGRGRKNSS